MRQHASLLTRYYHNVKVFAGDGGKFSGNIDIEINPLLGSRNKEVVKAHKAAIEGESEYMEGLSGKIYEYLLGSLKGLDVLIAHNVLTMPFNLPLSAALQRIGQQGLIPIISWNHDSIFLSGLPEAFGCLPLEYP